VGGGVGAGRDLGSFEDAFPDLLARSFRLASRMLGDRAAAQDVAADALAITLVRWSRIVDLSYRTAWVLRVTANLALRAAKREARATPQAWVNVRGNQGFEHEATLRVALVAALGALPKRQREAIILRYLSDLDEQHVAAILGVSAGTVKTHLHRGSQTLRERLGEDFCGEASFAAID
jgi:RNA polymerase sigma factor (sigma-70 family)